MVIRSVQRAEQTAQQATHEEQIQERDLHIRRLEQEVLGLKQEVETAMAAAGAESVCDRLREEISELKRNLSREDEEKRNRMMQMKALEQETSLAKERLVESQREQEKSLAKERLVESQREQEKSLAKERLVEIQREEQGRHRELLAVAEQTITEKDAGAGTQRPGAPQVI